MVKNYIALNTALVLYLSIEAAELLSNVKQSERCGTLQKVDKVVVHEPTINLLGKAIRYTVNYQARRGREYD